MLGRVSAFPQQAREGWKLGLKVKVPSQWRDSKELLIVGMGGSAIGGDLLSALLREKISRPILVNRTYTIPTWVSRKTWVIASSYSGNTEETLAASKEAVKRGARVAAITSGGELSSWALRVGIPLLKIPRGLPPRAALGFLTFGPLALLARLGWITQGSLAIEGICRRLDLFLERELSPSIPTRANLAKKIALALYGRLPVLYGASGEWGAVAFRWRTQLEENAKTLAFHHLFPEATHNEISGWDQPRRLLRGMTAIFLKDRGLHPRIKRRMEFFSSVVRKEKAQVLEVEVPGSLRGERILKMIVLGDFVSVYLSVLYRVDPTPVVRVEALKAYMRKG